MECYLFAEISTNPVAVGTQRVTPFIFLRTHTFPRFRPPLRIPDGQPVVVL